MFFKPSGLRVRTFIDCEVFETIRTTARVIVQISSVPGPFSLTEEFNDETHPGFADAVLTLDDTEIREK